MKRQIRKALVIVNLIKEETEKLAAQVRSDLERRGIEVHAGIAAAVEGTGGLGLDGDVFTGRDGDAHVEGAERSGTVSG